MSASTALWITLLSLGSCYACYRLGQANILHQFRSRDELRRERERRWREFYDYDEDYD